MKRTFLSLSLMLCARFLSAQVAERTYLSTDRDIYLAGDNLWCSAFCIDMQSGLPSGVSSVAYIELHSAEGLAMTGKIALEEGRGGGCFPLPASLPTGNYRLIAYTVPNRNETGYDYLGPCPKTLSVFNPLSTRRIAGGVLRTEQYEKKGGPAETASGFLSLDVPADARPGTVVPLVLTVPEGSATLSLSVYREDGIGHNANGTLVDFMSAVAATEPGAILPGGIPDYEGEVVRGHVTGADAATLASLTGRTAFIAAPGNPSDVYCSRIDPSGRVAFHTGNIYGDKDLLAEIAGLDSLSSCHIVLESPFAEPSVAAPEPLALHPDLAESLDARAAASRIERLFHADTLLEYLPVRDNLLFNESECITYRLDDYTRFPLMREVFVEFIPELRARLLADGRRDIQVRILENDVDTRFQAGKSLVMLDGVPVLNHEKIYDYDPLLVESIRIYPYRYLIGHERFDGIVNFVTYKRNLPSMTFSGNVRVVNFRGVSYPAAYTCMSASSGGTYPDYRYTAFWHPLVRVEAGTETRLDCLLPSGPGMYSVVAEGLAADGTPLFLKTTITVR